MLSEVKKYFSDKFPKVMDRNKWLRMKMVDEFRKIA